jgi:hypothetical protein
MKSKNDLRSPSIPPTSLHIVRYNSSNLFWNILINIDSNDIIKFKTIILESKGKFYNKEKIHDYW